MINLKNYIIESIFDIEDNIDNMDESIREEIKHFLKDNFKTNSTYQISKKPNKEGKFEYSIGRIVKVDDKHIRLDSWNYGYNIEDEDLILHLAKIE